MANLKSARKNARKAIRRREHNQALSTRLKSLAKLARGAPADDPAKARAAASAYISALDKAAKTGVIHANKVARAKSALAKVFAPAAAAASGA